MVLRSPPPSLLAFVAATLLYLLVEALAPPLTVGASQLLQPASGVALALVLLGGRHAHASVLLGAVLGQALTPGVGVAAGLAQALAAWVAAALGAQLLRRHGLPERYGHSLRSNWQWLLCAGALAPGLGALVNASTLLAAGQISASAWPATALHWWQGHALGMVLVGALALAWWHRLRTPQEPLRLTEGVLVYGLTLGAGQIIFSGTAHPALAPLAGGYWMFLGVAWAGVRLGMLGTVGLLCLVALQALGSVVQGSGFFALDLLASHGLAYSSYMAILALVALSLAAYVDQHQRQNARLRVAAIAFECQEGLLITDARHAILRANQSFFQLSGYAVHEVLGRTPHFLYAPPGPGQTAAGAAPAGAAPLQREAWLQRKDGSRFLARIGTTPVHDRHTRTTHCVLTLVDITQQHAQQVQQQAREKAHHEALVREVHHRIKNNLQGIVGLMQRFEQAHPQLHAPLTQLMSQVQSIAVLHGLQGRAQIDQVRLCELTAAIASGLQALWQTPVVLDIPAHWQPCLLLPSEAVPVALVLNELMLNAIKHGGQEHQDVQLALRKGPQADTVQIAISNPQPTPSAAGAPPVAPALPDSAQAVHHGLDLVSALMPRSGATLQRQCTGQRTTVQLTLQPPVLQLDTRSLP